MTRVTSLGIKRTHLQAGFSESDAPQEPEPNPPEVSQPPKKKRKRTKMSQRDGNKAKNTEGTDAATSSEPNPSTAAAKVPAKKSKPKKPKYVSPSEQRRLKRIEERNAATTCFACRLKGHSARDCPSSQSGGKSAVGICYRCGSTRHSLARCKKPADPLNSLPFASCFVCSGKGHLASTCPQNLAKGVYPNGGCCKLCGETSHLAKDCGLRKQDSTKDATIFGVEQDAAAADEDSFHTLLRRKKEVDRDEKAEGKLRRMADIRAGAHSGVVKSFGTGTKANPQKVVYF